MADINTYLSPEVQISKSLTNSLINYQDILCEVLDLAPEARKVVPAFTISSSVKHLDQKQLTADPQKATENYAYTLIADNDYINYELFPSGILKRVKC